MTDQTLKATFYEAMDRIQKLEASKTDLALVFIGAELIDARGGSAEMAKVVSRLEAKWTKAQGEYARGEVN